MTIKEMRERTGWTQQWFADYFGIPKRTLQDWELGNRKCPEYLRKLIEYKLFSEEIIMNNKITYKFTNNYDESTTNNGFNDETEYIVTDGVYDFEDYLQDHDVRFETDEDCEGLYFVIDEFEERTGEAYMIIGEESTSEELMG